MKLVLDEHFSAKIAVELRRRGHDVVAVTEISTLRQSTDDELLQWAGAENRVLVTEDAADFLPLHARLLAEGRRHHGLVLTSHQRFPTATAGIGALVSALYAFLSSASGACAARSEVWWLMPEG